MADDHIHRVARRVLSIARGIATLAAIVWAASSYAQVARPDSAAGGTDEKTVSLEEIVVSAQRRKENSQDVPISVTSISGAAAINAGIADTGSFSGMVPSLISINAGPQQVFFLRGVGASISAPNAEQSVALYVDGVYIWAPEGNTFPIGEDLDRIEVLKGPQGTLFGRNATAGVVQIFTKDPSQDAGGAASIGYGNYNTVTGDFYGTTGIGENLAANLSVYEKHMGEGFGRDIFNGSAAYRNDETSVRSKWLWTPADGTEVRANFGFAKISGSTYEVQNLPGHPTVTGQILTVGPLDTDASGNDRYDTPIYSVSLQVDHDFSIGKLEDIASFRDVAVGLYRSDNTATPQVVVQANGLSPSKVYTEELRFLSPASSKFNGVAGAFYIHAFTGLDPLYLTGAAFGPPPAAINEFDTQTLWAVAEYAQGTLEILPATDFTAGVRYNDEHLSSSGTTVALPTNVPSTPCDAPCGGTVLVQPVPESTKYDNISWRASLDHKWARDIMTYISANRGFKSGGYNLAALPGTVVPPFLPEELTAYEAGLKSEFDDRRFRFNFAYYHYQYKNIQVQEDLPVGFLTLNGPSALFNGIDADFQAAITERFTVSSGLNHVSGHYGYFPNAVGYPELPSLGAFVFNATGKTALNAPSWSGTLSADYAISSGAGEFAFNANATARTYYYVAVSNRLKNPGYAVMNDSITWTPPNGRYALRLWAANIFDKLYLNNVSETGEGDQQVWAPPRTFGITASMKFGAYK